MIATIKQIQADVKTHIEVAQHALKYSETDMQKAYWQGNLDALQELQKRVLSSPYIKEYDQQN